MCPCDDWLMSQTNGQIKSKYQKVFIDATYPIQMGKNLEKWKI